MQIITLDGKVEGWTVTKEQAEYALLRVFGDFYTSREYNFQLGNELFFKMPKCPDARLVSVYEVDETRDIFMLSHADGWVTKISNSFTDMVNEGHKIALRGIKRYGVPEGWIIRRFSDNIQLVVTK